MRSQRGHDLLAESGDGLGILNAEPASMEFRELDHMAVIVPRSALGQLVADPELASTRLVPRTNEAFRLLRAYLMGLRDNGGISDPSLCKLAVTHVYDLVALTPRTVQLLFEETGTNSPPTRATNVSTTRTRCFAMPATRAGPSAPSPTGPALATCRISTTSFAAATGQRRRRCARRRRFRAALMPLL